MEPAAGQSQPQRLLFPISILERKLELLVLLPAKAMALMRLHFISRSASLRYPRYDMPSPSKFGFYFDRTSGRRGNHCDSRFTPFAIACPLEGNCPFGQVLEQSPANQCRVSSGCGRRWRTILADRVARSHSAGPFLIHATRPMESESLG